MIEIKVPALGESQNIAVIARWLKQVGDYVNAGENILELETDKVGIDVPAPISGLLCDMVAEGTEVEVGAVIASVDETQEQPIKAEQNIVESSPIKEEIKEKAVIIEPIEEKEAPLCDAPLKNMMHQNGIRREKMSRLRQTIARNLKNAQNTAAILTTFNEIDMGAVKDLRATYKEAFEKRHNGVRLGFMSFFARAVIEALKDYPILNAQIEGEDILYYDHVNLGIAVGTDRGLVVPVLHHAEEMSFRDLEKNISDYGKRARQGALALSELTGGSFTITNGGIFGSLLSTPILNAPQSGVLGMHAIQERPVARHGEVVIRPMMYVALSYDHRLIDGSDAVRFLVRIKELIEDPRRLLLDV